MKSIICIVLFLLSFNTFADDIKLEKPSINRLMRPVTLLGNWAYIDLWIPGKYGLGFSYNFRDNVTWELEYLTGKIGIEWSFFEIGSFQEQKMSLLRRKFVSTSSFNYFAGLTYSDIKVSVGNEIIDRVSSFQGGNVFKISKLNLTLGLGNRWVVKSKFTIGCDWFSLNIPVHNLDEDTRVLDENLDADDRDDVEKVIKYLKYIPGLTLLKLQIGYSF